MAIEAKPFYDPQMAYTQRRLAYETQTGIADQELKGQRLVEDANLFRPYLMRRFGRQAERTAGNVASRGFHGSGSGIMRDALGDLGEEQAYTAGEFERKTSRGLEDVQRAIANLAGRNTLLGAESVLQGAGNASERALPRW